MTEQGILHKNVKQGGEFHVCLERKVMDNLAGYFNLHMKDNLEDLLPRSLISMLHMVRERCVRNSYKLTLSGVEISELTYHWFPNYPLN